jgi:hypothetical protein
VSLTRPCRVDRRTVVPPLNDLEFDGRSVDAVAYTEDGERRGARGCDQLWVAASPRHVHHRSGGHRCARPSTTGTSVNAAASGTLGPGLNDALLAQIELAANAHFFAVESGREAASTLRPPMNVRRPRPPPGPPSTPPPELIATSLNDALLAQIELAANAHFTAVESGREAASTLSAVDTAALRRDHSQKTWSVILAPIKFNDDEGGTSWFAA